jgi:hypothetical protein
VHLELQRLEQRDRTQVTDAHAHGLARDPGLAVVLLDDEVEEQGQHSAMDHPRRALECQRERDRAGGMVTGDGHLIAGKHGL